MKSFRASRSGVELRPLRPADYDELYDHLLAPDGPLDAFVGGTPGPEDFVKAIWSGVHAQFVSEWQGRAIGVLAGHSLRPRDRVIQLTHITYNRGDDCQHGRALHLFLVYLFRSCGVQKVATAVGSDRVPLFFARGGGVFVEEGVLRAHQLVDGKYRDTHLYAAFRDDAEPLIARSLDRDG
jgi:hypothetical protein